MLFAPCLTVSWLLPFYLAFLSVPSSADRPHACADGFNLFPFCNLSLPLEDRVSDLLSRLSLEEKIDQLVSNASEIPRLGILSYYWWGEALHGLSDDGPGVSFNGNVHAVTIYPQVILSAASFNRTLWNLIAQAVSTEARAMYNLGQAGLTVWSPNVNIFRDPRWGRGQETPGEDPLLSSEYAVAYVAGLQGGYYNEESRNSSVMLERNGSRQNLKLSACCKHFTAYDLEAWQGYTRYTFDAKVSLQDLYDTFQPPFKSCIRDGQATCLMCSYNRVNGIPACADEYLLSDIARNEWGFQGYIVSDCDAVAVVYEYMAYASSPEDAAADCLNAGLDLNCGSYLARHTPTAIQKGFVNISVIDRALTNLFTTRMRLGLFDGDPKLQPYGWLGIEAVCSETHRQLALEAARQGLVLLKNENALLPLSKEKVQMLAVIGPNANSSTESLLGDYSGPPCNAVTALDGLMKYADVIFHPGCSNVSCVSDSLIEAAADCASSADAVVLVVGLDQTQESEGLDRNDLLLPGNQEELISAVADAAKGSVILVILSGGPIDVTFAKENSKIGSIIWAGYPGEAGGQAIGDVIFGEYNPGGRLPVTWYPQNFTKVSMADMSMRPNLSTGFPGRTYRFYRGEPVFPFGYGLSYMNISERLIFSPSQVVLLSCMENSTSSVCYLQGDNDNFHSEAEFSVVIRVINCGNIAGDHSMLLFSKPLSNQANYPQKQLIDFKKVSLKPRQSVDVAFTINPYKHMALVNEDGRKMIPVGSHSLFINDMIEHTLLLRFASPNV